MHSILLISAGLLALYMTNYIIGIFNKPVVKRF